MATRTSWTNPRERKKKKIRIKYYCYPSLLNNFSPLIIDDSKFSRLSYHTRITRIVNISLIRIIKLLCSEFSIYILWNRVYIILTNGSNGIKHQLNCHTSGISGTQFAKIESLSYVLLIFNSPKLLACIFIYIKDVPKLTQDLN